MDWTTRIVKTIDGYRPEYRCADGSLEIDSFARLGRSQKVGTEGLRMRIRIELSSLRVAAAHDCPVSAWCKPCAGHDIYVFQWKRRTYFLPASVLLVALLTTNPATWREAMCAGSLGRLGVARIAGEQSTFMFWPRALDAWSRHAPKVRERFLWLASFPSAARFWASIYSSASRGVLGAILPRARVDITLRGEVLDGAFIVRHSQVLSITPTEEPYPFAGALLGRTFALRKNLGRRQGPALHMRRVDDRLIAGRAGWRLTEREWGVIRGLLGPPKYAFRNRNARKAIDAILTKLATRTTWAAARNESSSAYLWYIRLKKDGRWSSIVSALGQMRAESPSNSSG